jgi:hypothetical protein
MAGGKLLVPAVKRPLRPRPGFLRSALKPAYRLVLKGPMENRFDEAASIMALSTT